MTQFRAFHAYRYTDKVHGGCWRNAAEHLSEWLKENPDVEVLHWQAVPTEDSGYFSIVIEYKKKETHFAEACY